MENALEEIERLQEDGTIELEMWHDDDGNFNLLPFIVLEENDPRRLRIFDTFLAAVPDLELKHSKSKMEVNDFAAALANAAKGGRNETGERVAGVRDSGSGEDNVPNPKNNHSIKAGRRGKLTG